MKENKKKIDEKTPTFIIGKDLIKKIKNDKKLAYCLKDVTLNSMVRQ